MDIKDKQIQFLKINTRKYLYDFWLGDFLNIIQCTNHENRLAFVQPHVMDNLSHSNEMKIDGYT